MFNSIHQNFQFSTPFLRGYKQLKIPIIDDAGISAWPELFPPEKIDELRNIVGPRHFSAQMMLEYTNEDKARLDPGALRFYDYEFDPRSAKLGDYLVNGVVVYWDPSSGRVKSDGSVCVLVYKDDKNRCAFVHDIVYLKVSDQDMHPLASQCDQVLKFMQIYNLRKIGIEVNGIGNALPEILQESAKKQGQPLIVQKVINHQNKEMRILDAIEPLLSTGRLYAHSRLKQTPFLAEMLGWSPVMLYQSDDALDAVAGALRMQALPVRGASSVFRPYKAQTDFNV